MTPLTLALLIYFPAMLAGAALTAAGIACGQRLIGRKTNA